MPMSRRELNRLLAYGFGSVLLAACERSGITDSDALRGAISRATATRTKTRTKTRTATRTAAKTATATRTNTLSPTVTAQALQTLGFDAFPDLVATHRDDTYLYVESRGIPNHTMMVGITSWQRQVPLAQNYAGSKAWQVPLHPTPAVNPISARSALYRGAIAIAVNGVPIFNALNNRGDDAFLAGELDNWGGHAGRADDYHYHIAPLHLQTLIGYDKPIAYALDGYAIYGLTEVDGSTPVGLDAYNGHIGPNGVYHYHASLTYPYINGGLYGTVTVRDDQIEPQPALMPVRPPQDPLPGAVITDFTRTSGDAYTLSFRYNSTNYSVAYTQTASAVTFHHHDHDGDRDVSYPVRAEQIPPTPLPTQSATTATAKPASSTTPTPTTASATATAVTTGLFTLTSAAVGADGVLPAAYTCDGVGNSPPLSWANAPAGTQSFAIIMHHVAGLLDVHWYWTLYNIPATITSLSAGQTSVGTFGSNSVNPALAYAPPCSKGPGLKQYTITIYALAQAPVLSGGASVTRDTLLAAIADRTLATAVLDVTYTR
jgi:phosphatidylethanolamine-binding protein (PEBP) family uncharacterized protein